MMVWLKLTLLVWLILALIVLLYQIWIRLSGDTVAISTTAPTAPTAAPTVSWTAAPAAAPTAAPTVSWTAAPAAAPTAAPTAPPTAAPTAAPTVSWTAAPTAAPTAAWLKIAGECSTSCGQGIRINSHVCNFQDTCGPKPADITEPCTSTTTCTWSLSDIIWTYIT